MKTELNVFTKKILSEYKISRSFWLALGVSFGLTVVNFSAASLPILEVGVVNIPRNVAPILLSSAFLLSSIIQIPFSKFLDGNESKVFISLVVILQVVGLGGVYFNTYISLVTACLAFVALILGINGQITLMSYFIMRSLNDTNRAKYVAISFRAHILAQALSAVAASIWSNKLVDLLIPIEIFLKLCIAIMAWKLVKTKSEYSAEACKAMPVILNIDKNLFIFTSLTAIFIIISTYIHFYTLPFFIADYSNSSSRVMYTAQAFKSVFILIAAGIVTRRFAKLSVKNKVISGSLAIFTSNIIVVNFHSPYLIYFSYALIGLALCIISPLSSILIYKMYGATNSGKAATHLNLLNSVSSFICPMLTFIINRGSFFLSTVLFASVLIFCIYFSQFLKDERNSFEQNSI